MSYRDSLPQPGVPPTSRALVVEDDSDTREALCRLARNLGYIVESARGVREAIAKLGNVPDRLILDLRLPDGSGLSLLRHIRDQDLRTDVAVVTGALDDEALAEAVLMRPDALFTKPADMTEIAAWLRSRRERRILPPDEQRGAGATL